MTSEVTFLFEKLLLFYLLIHKRQSDLLCIFCYFYLITAAYRFLSSRSSGLTKFKYININLPNFSCLAYKLMIFNLVVILIYVQKLNFVNFLCKSSFQIYCLCILFILLQAILVLVA